MKKDGVVAASSFFMFIFKILQNNKYMKKILILSTLLVTLVIGSASPTFAQHCDVQKGDTMWKIAKRYHVSLMELIRINRGEHPNADLIHPKDEVELPNGGEGTSTDKPADSGSDNSVNSEGEVIDAYAKEVLKLVNAERQKQGLTALTLSGKLTNLATMKSKDMADKKYFSHTSPTYGTPYEMLRNYGVSYSYAGENIAAGQKTPSEVMKSWMNSSGHRANILSKNYTQLGVGYYTGGSYGTYWTQMFIKP